MPITFENDNNVIVYALEKVICYARQTQQIFVAQCVWWLASIIGLELELIVHIDNRRIWQSLTTQKNSESIDKDQEILSPPEIPLRDYSGQVHPDRILQIDNLCAVSPTPRDNQEDLRLGPEENKIHPQRRSQENSVNLDISDLDLNATNQDPRLEVIDSTRAFLAKSRKERKLFNKQKKIDRLSRTRSGKVLKHPLTQGQRKYLQCIPKDTIQEYLEDTK
jgi:hypothetical protein